MEKISIQKYKNFEIEYFILPKTKKFLKLRGISFKDLIKDNFALFESEIGDEIEGHDWEKFQLVYYGIIEKLLDKSEGFEEDFKYDKKKILVDGYLRLQENDKKHPFGLRYKIMRL